MDYKESTIKTYSGLSSETKPTIAGGTDVPNGSRWREVDTEKTYYFNLADDAWYEKSDFVIISDDDGNNASVVGAGQDELKVSDREQRDLLSDVIKQLKIMNLHLSILTDNVLDEEEI